MSDFLKQHYGPAEEPLGFPQTDKQARALEALLKELPREDAFRYRKRVVPLARAKARRSASLIQRRPGARSSAT